MVVGEIVEMVRLFTEVALRDPLSFVLVLSGAAFVGASSAVFGYLTLRGLVEWVTPDRTAGPPTQAE